MADYLLLVLVLLPLVLAGGVALVKSPSLLSLVFVVAGMLGGLIIMPLSGTFWLQLLMRSTFESQGGGIGFIAVLLPFFAFSGGVAGAWAIAISYGYWGRSPQLLLFQAVGWLLSMILGGLLPVAIARIPWPSTSISLSSHGGNLTWLGLIAIANGILSAWLGCELTRRLL